MDNEALFRAVVRTQIGLWEGVDGAVRAGHGLPLVQYLPLRVVAETPRCRVQDVAVALRLTTGGATQAVDRVVAAGLLTRRPNPDDRRSSLLDLTPEGAARLEAAATTIDAELARRFAALPEATLETLREGLAVLDGGG